MIISIIGMGFVGSSIYNSLKLKKINIKCYDKFKESDSLEDCINSEIIFLCLPTLFDEITKEYDKSAIHEICTILNEKNYKGIILLKSTVEPGTTEKLVEKYNLKIIHNPEFLTARTAFEDFHNQSHIVLGKSKIITDEEINLIENFYKNNYTNNISICDSVESESMKLFCNSFYSVKIQFFNELYLLCNKINCNYDNVKNLMLKNGWINKMHTDVPGPDGKLSYGGMCFPKDTNALLNFMKINNSECDVLESTINERNKIRNNSI
jgi:UDPglucose 6-dehydrogenase